MNDLLSETTVVVQAPSTEGFVIDTEFVRAVEERFFEGNFYDLPSDALSDFCAAAIAIFLERYEVPLNG